MRGIPYTPLGTDNVESSVIASLCESCPSDRYLAVSARPPTLSIKCVSHDEHTLHHFARTCDLPPDKALQTRAPCSADTRATKTAPITSGPPSSPTALFAPSLSLWQRARPAYATTNEGAPACCSAVCIQRCYAFVHRQPTRTLEDPSPHAQRTASGNIPRSQNMEDPAEIGEHL